MDALSFYAICNLATFICLTAFLCSLVFRLERFVEPTAIVTRLITATALCVQHRFTLLIALFVLSALLAVPTKARRRSVAPFALLSLLATAFVPNKYEFARLFVLPAAGTAAAATLAGVAMILSSYLPALEFQEEIVHRQLVQIYMVLAALGSLKTANHTPILAFASQYLMLLNEINKIDHFKTIDETNKLVAQDKEGSV